MRHYLKCRRLLSTASAINILADTSLQAHYLYATYVRTLTSARPAPLYVRIICVCNVHRSHQCCSTPLCVRITCVCDVRTCARTTPFDTTLRAHLCVRKKHTCMCALINAGRYYACVSYMFIVRLHQVICGRPPPSFLPYRRVLRVGSRTAAFDTGQRRLRQ